MADTKEIGKIKNVFILIVVVSLLIIIVLWISFNKNIFQETFWNTNNFRSFLNAIWLIIISFWAIILPIKDAIYRRKNVKYCIEEEFDINCEKVEIWASLFQDDFEERKKWRREIAVQDYDLYKKIKRKYDLFKKNGLIKKTN